MGHHNYSWIWHPDWTEERASKTAGGMLHFRRRFSLDQVPTEQWIIHITADTRYKLYINSRLVSIGPVKGDSQLWFYDEIDIQPFVRVGENHIAIRVLRFYHATAFATSFPRMPFGGLLVQDVSPRSPVNIQGNGSWETAIDITTRLPVDIEDDDFLHFYEKVDARREGELKWTMAKPLKLFDAYGIEPPWKLSPRLIPFQQFTLKAFKAIHNIRSTLPQDNWTKALLGREYAGGICLPAGTKHHIEIETFHHMTALLTFRFGMSVAPGSTLEVTYLECYEDVPKLTPYLRSKSDRLNTTKGLFGPRDHFTFGGLPGDAKASIPHYDMAEDDVVFSPYHFRTMRILAIDIEVTEDADLLFKDIEVTESTYPLEPIAVVEIPAPLEASTSTLKLWSTSIQTLRNCMHDCYEDCPFYEQLQYAMDTRSSALFTYRVSGDDRLARQAIIQLKNTFQPDIGLTASRGPAHGLQIIPNFSLFWVLMLCDHYEYFGDAKFVRGFLPIAHAVLESFEACINDDFGLVGPTANPKHWDFVDWTERWKPFGTPPAGARTGFQTFSSSLYAYTLKLMGNLLAGLGREALAAEYRSRATLLTNAVRKHCFDGQFFTDGLAKGANPSIDYSQQNQIWAVLSGAATGVAGQQILASSLGNSSTAHKFSPASIAMSFYSLRALSDVGGTVYNDLFHQSWEPWRMQHAKNVSTWVEDSVSQRSDCHAWGSAPIYELMAEVAGIKPTKPGCTEIIFKPRIALYPEFKAKVPIGGMGGKASLVATVQWQPSTKTALGTRVSICITSTSRGFTSLPVLTVLPHEQEKIVNVGADASLFEVLPRIERER